jgi:hypothetical protein
MRFVLRIFAVLLFLLAAAGVARAGVCVAVDETHDALSPSDRAAAVRIVGKQFELEGQSVTPQDCTERYTLSHLMLGNTIYVTLVGPLGHKEGTALGKDDLPALYSQMVRSIVTGRPMTGFNVIDRTNVTAAQTSRERVTADGLWYARLGYGGVFGDRTYGAPAMGFGYRVELDSFAVDVSFFNYQIATSHNYSYSYYGGTDHVFVGSLVKLEGLYFLDPEANQSAYAGGGISWGGTHFGNNWNGSGLQGELTAGYELLRASTLRAFVQADAVLPFYRVTSVRYQPYRYPPSPTDFRQPPPPITERRYASSIVVSVGLGWQRHRTGRR